MSNRFWVVDRPMMMGPTAFAEPVGAAYGPAPQCPVCNQPIGPKMWLEPHRARLRRGTRSNQPGDIITGPGFDGFLASRRVVEAIESAGVSGFNGWQHVELVNWKGDGYMHTVFPAPAVRVTFPLMHVEFVRPPECNHCQGAVLRRLRGVVVDDATWRGQDVFYLMSPGLLLATERLKNLIERNGFTGLEFVAAEEFVPSWSR